MSLPTPISETQRRLPQAGRIRLGMKGGKQGRQSIDTFRFTSADRDLITPVAETYGGEVKPWKDAKSGDRYELISQATKLSVVLPPDPLSEHYELWSGNRGLERRCDGGRGPEACALLVPGPDGPEISQQACVCRDKGVLECSYKLRLSVQLPEVASLGVWRLDTGSEHARKEIPTVVDAIEQLQGRGFYTAVLRLEQRTAPGKRFNVPVLDPGVSIESLSAGAARLGQLPGATATPEAKGLAAGDPPSPAASFAHDDDDEIVEAEIVEDEHVDPTIGRAFLEALSGHQKNRALLRAREISEERDLPLPTTLAAVDPLVVDRLIEEFMT